MQSAPKVVRQPARGGYPDQTQQAPCSQSVQNEKPQALEGTSGTVARRAAFRSGKHRFSGLSERAVSKLFSTEEQLDQIEARMQEILAAFPRAIGSEIGSLKMELIQLETRLKKLESAGVDDVCTGDLK